MNKDIEADIFGFSRAGGILLHPTSLPGEYGIGDLGKEAFRFVDLLHEYKQSIWQILPFGPTGYGNSPYQSLSTFAGNPFLISPELLRQQGLLSAGDIEIFDPSDHSTVDYSRVITHKRQILKKAYKNYQQKKMKSLIGEFDLFKKSNINWLDEFSTFVFR